MKFTILAVLIVILIASFILPFLYKELRNLASLFVNPAPRLYSRGIGVITLRDYHATSSTGLHRWLPWGWVNWIFGNAIPGSDAKPGDLAPAAQTDAPSIPTSTTKSKIQNRVPENFRGPVGEPHIIGPSGPPPNY
ncbi:MAG: hypothetical protein HY434_00385 [Candidatus Liptonbacteria bacterium]|nr:hypothetical protein [Candidatus Liptonbacteria bacterium]